jgi:hypothetical protein
MPVKSRERKESLVRSCNYLLHLPGICTAHFVKIPQGKQPRWPFEPALDKLPSNAPFSRQWIPRVSLWFGNAGNHVEDLVAVPFINP